jgi:hypothetical protein
MDLMHASHWDVGTDDEAELSEDIGVDFGLSISRKGVRMKLSCQCPCWRKVGEAGMRNIRMGQHARRLQGWSLKR